MTLPIEIAEWITATAPDLSSPPELKQDAVVVRLPGALTLTIRHAAPDAYSFHWTDGHVEARIDTAPLHPTLATFPNHLHKASGAVMADPLTRPDAPARDNVASVLAALSENPRLGLDTAAPPAPA